MILIPAAVKLIMLVGPDKQLVEINPEKIVSLRAPRIVEHFARETRCLVFTSDGKFIAVRETCREVQKHIDEAD